MTVDAREPVRVYTTTNPAEAEVLKAVLEGEGILCEVEGESQAGLTGILGMKLLVRAQDEGRAREVLASHAHHKGGEGKQEEE